MNDNFDNTIKELEKKVSKFAKTSNIVQNNGKGIFSDIMSKIKNNSTLLLYASIPIIFGIVLLLLKPSFIIEEVTNDDNLVVKKIIIKKFLISTFIGGSLLCLLVFMYFRKKRINEG